MDVHASTVSTLHLCCISVDRYYHYYDYDDDDYKTRVNVRSFFEVI